jgi:hypothetical protein
MERVMELKKSPLDEYYMVYCSHCQIYNKECGIGSQTELHCILARILRVLEAKNFGGSGQHGR